MVPTGCRRQAPAPLQVPSWPHDSGARCSRRAGRADPRRSRRSGRPGRAGCTRGRPRRSRLAADAIDTMAARAGAAAVQAAPGWVGPPLRRRSGRRRARRHLRPRSRRPRRRRRRPPGRVGERRTVVDLVGHAVAVAVGRRRRTTQHHADGSAASPRPAPPPRRPSHTTESPTRPWTCTRSDSAPACAGRSPPCPAATVGGRRGRESAVVVGHAASSNTRTRTMATRGALGPVITVSFRLAGISPASTHAAASHARASTAIAHSSLAPPHRLRHLPGDGGQPGTPPGLELGDRGCGAAAGIGIGVQRCARDARGPVHLRVDRRLRQRAGQQLAQGRPGRLASSRTQPRCRSRPVRRRRR